MAIPSVDGNKFNTLVGSYDLDMDVFNALSMEDRATTLRKQLLGTSQHSLADDVADYFTLQSQAAQAKASGRTDDYNAYMRMLGEEPLSLNPTAYESLLKDLQSIPAKSGEDARGLAFSTLKATGTDPDKLANDIGYKAQEAARNSGFGTFLKNAAPLLAIGGSAILAPALFGAAGATGISAGNAGLGSSLFSNLSTSGLLKGALTGGIGGYMSGGDLGSALKGAGLGGLTGGFGNALAGGLGISSAAGQSAFTGALQSAAGGLASGDTKGAALGAALGGIGGYITGGGDFPGRDAVMGKQVFGPATASQVANAGGTNAALSGLGSKGGITGALSSALGGGGSSFSGGNSMLGGNAIKLGTALYGDYSNKMANKEIEKRLLEGQNQALGALKPYQQSGLSAQQQLSQALSAGFNPGDLQNDPGYQFQLQEGEKALGRSMASQGMSQSGAALKAAQKYGQGLANTTYDDAYQRWLAQNQQLAGVANTGFGAAQNAGNIYSNIGLVQGSRLNANQDSKNQLLAALSGLF